MKARALVILAHAIDAHRHQAHHFHAAGYDHIVGPRDHALRGEVHGLLRRAALTIEELRKEYGTEDDDELILRALVPGEGLEKMRKAGPVKTTYPYLSSPELDQVRRLMTIARSPLVEIKAADFELTLRKNA